MKPYDPRPTRKQGVALLVFAILLCVALYMAAQVGGWMPALIGIGALYGIGMELMNYGTKTGLSGVEQKERITGCYI